MVRLRADAKRRHGDPADSGFRSDRADRAFSFGFLLYLPFVAIDLAITAILIALGMQLVQPTIISVPFKILLFVVIDGWAKLVEGLLLSYTVT